MFKENKLIILAGIIIGIISISLVHFGNPANMGVCIACFLRDISGALGLQRVDTVQYLRPEIMGIILGAFLMSRLSKDFSSRGGSSPFIRFILGVIIIIGALMFLGCPTRLIFRLGGGDLNALVGLFGYVFGIYIGIIFLNKGFSLKRNYKASKLEGYSFPVINMFLAVALFIPPSFIIFSSKGPGASHAPIIMSLILGGVVGILCQKTRLCTVGGIRDIILFKDTYLISGFVAILLSVFVGNIILGKFNLGFTNQPIAHNDGLWNFMGMTVVGWGSVLLGGCPLRQLILSGEGNGDSMITVLGMIAGGAFSHNFGLASSAKGPTGNGMIAVIICIGVLLLISLFSIDKKIVIKGKKGVSIGEGRR
ncbi:YedE family putative selenium transporter [Clostridium hydrogeniformans]|uniref:YedE family putative selenium transporter n=1 Tax=Clostridium hydrogeniformans TaxID=349933 RepID=UPI0004899561|nr:YedE family putative selenium transporter [Clostridium hydrogeniformans]